MANKKNKPTFASRARDIIKKYKRANWDSIEKEQLDRELAALAQEQEQYRQANGMGNYSDNRVRNGKHDGITPGSNSILAPNEQSQFDYTLGINTYTNPMTELSKNAPQQLDVPAFQDVVSGGPEEWAPINDYRASMTSTSAGMLPTSGLSNYSTSIIPSIASGAITAGANMFMANRAMRDIPEMSLNRLSPEEISLARERSGVQRQSSIAGRIARSNAARGSRTRGEYLSTAAAQEAAMNRGTAEALSGLYSQEARMNAAERARVSEANARLQAQEAQANFMAQQQARANRDAYTSAAIQAIPQTMMNVAGIRQQDALINSLGQDYSIGQYQDPSLNWFQKITQPKQIVRRYKE
jgi:hypothetical protein